eukprot:TRINITY_DN72767_c0_g1_i1.p1 TRINITY_DN72767_c0_g1~~TRINITY_DN72767_c0_g1_i1.p1  ORF type:complete len:525 (-),score=66.60 TRINITY_DN72767_c0_g1_i1:172-1518(-)
MAYTMPVNVCVLGHAIPDMSTQLHVAVALSSAIGCFLMGTLSGWPIMLAPGMGTNAFFAFTVVLSRGLPWQSALAAVFVASCIFLALSVTGLGTLMIRCFPHAVREAIGVGIGLFLTFISFQGPEGMGLTVSNEAVLVGLNSLSPDSYDAAKIWLSLLVLCITTVLYSVKMPGAAMFGILLGTLVCWIEGWMRGEDGTVFGYPFGIDGAHADPRFHMYLPNGFFEAPRLDGLSGAFIHGLKSATNEHAAEFWSAVLTFCYTDLLDSTGTFFAVAKFAGLADATGKLPIGQQNMGYIADAFAAMCGSMLGVSTVGTYGESGAAVSDGAKTGLSPLVTGACFLVSIFLAPLVSAIPPLATGPILLIVGSMMFADVKKINWSDHEESMPAFITIVTMAFTFNIGYGIIFGVVIWFVVQVLLMPFRIFKGTDPLIRFRGPVPEKQHSTEVDV